MSTTERAGRTPSRHAASDNSPGKGARVGTSNPLNLERRANCLERPCPGRASEELLSMRTDVLADEGDVYIYRAVGGPFMRLG